MNNKKNILLELKFKIIILKILREKSAIEKCMLRRHEPKRIKKPILLIAKRKR